MIIIYNTKHRTGHCLLCKTVKLQQQFLIAVPITYQQNIVDSYQMINCNGGFTKYFQ